MGTPINIKLRDRPIRGSGEAERAYSNTANSGYTKEVIIASGDFSAGTVEVELNGLASRVNEWLRVFIIKESGAAIINEVVVRTLKKTGVAIDDERRVIYRRSNILVDAAPQSLDENQGNFGRLVSVSPIVTRTNDDVRISRSLFIEISAVVAADIFLLFEFLPMLTAVDQTI